MYLIDLLNFIREYSNSNQGFVTLLSTIAIFLSVLISLFGEKINNFFKKKKILKSLDDEFRKNYIKLEEINKINLNNGINYNKIGKFEPKKIIKLVDELNLEVWNLNKSFLSIYFPEDYFKYKEINVKLTFIKYYLNLINDKYNDYREKKSRSEIIKSGFQKDFDKLKKNEIKFFLDMYYLE